MWLTIRFLVLLITLIISLNAVSSEELLELSCIDANDCTQFMRKDVNVTCSNGRCRCSRVDENSTTGDIIIKCSPIDLKQSNIIGGPCPCHIPHSECNESENICYCKKHFMTNSDKRRCLHETVALGKTCELDSQCHAVDHHAVCNPKNKKCTCRPNFISYNETCISLADQNSTCKDNQDCQKYGDHVHCLIGPQKCACLNGFISSQNRSECLPVVSYHENCTDHQQCQTHLGPGSGCYNGTCECSDKHYLWKKEVKTENDGNVTHNSCVPIIEIGQYCDEDRDCYHLQFSDEEQTMRCFFSECNCKWGFNSLNNMECFKSSGESLFNPLVELTILLITVGTLV